MKRNASFCCDDSRNIYENYYVKGQRGSGMPVFIGSRYQRGHGIGNILRSVLRHVVGFFTNNGRGAQFLRKNRDTMVSNLIKTGFEVADDVARGRKLKESLKKQVPRGIKRAAQNVDWQSGSGAPTKKQLIRSRRSRRRPRRRKPTNDIFG